MRLPRRQFLRLAASAAAVPALSPIASAQAYPSRPVRLIVGFPPGGGADILARLMGQWVSERLGQPFIIENRPGAGTNIATEAVVRAPPDGHTLLLAGTVGAINMTLYDKLNFNFIRDITPIASIARGPLVMVVNPSFPARTVTEFITYARSNPGKINMASAGTGSTNHVTGELFKAMTGTNLIHVPYRGDVAALTDLLGGQVHIHFSTLSGSIPYIRAGTLRALAVTTATRSEALPDTPTIAESVPGYESSIWNGIVAPRGTPAEVVSKLNNEINAALADPRIKTRLDELGSVPMPMTAADFGNLIADETEKWGKVIRAANIKPE
jgi:tripartite-type tricarboxylate transporter receptor subunit TctC